MKTRLFLSTLFVTLLISLATFGQEIKVSYPKMNECKITYEVTYPEGQPSDMAAADLPTERIVYIKGDMMRIETKTKTGTDVLIVDLNNQVATNLLENGQNKYALKTTKADVKKDAEAIPFLQVKETDDFKQIAGYNCQKQDYTITDKSNHTLHYDIYTNNRIEIYQPNWYNALFKEVKGIMFEYSLLQNGVTVKFTAKSFQHYTADDGIFKIPSEYKSVTKDQLSDK